MRELLLKFDDILKDRTVLVIGYYDEKRQCKIEVKDVLVNGRQVYFEVENFLIDVIGSEAIEAKVIETLECIDV